MMRRLVGHVLDFIELFNQGLSLPSSPLHSFELQQPFDYPRDEEGVRTACILPERQNRDFEPVFLGDPLFQTLVSGVTLPCCGDWEPVYPVFINEAAYYSKGIAFWGCKQTAIQLPAIGGGAITHHQ
ncbi:ACY2 Aspartoacylase, partial [Polyodon spathula]|nr:ACY2 Aspartoacylase [Polyodon spathula]